MHNHRMVPDGSRTMHGHMVDYRSRTVVPVRTAGDTGRAGNCAGGALPWIVLAHRDRAASSGAVAGKMVMYWAMVAGVHRMVNHMGMMVAMPVMPGGAAVGFGGESGCAEQSRRKYAHAEEFGHVFHFFGFWG